MWGVTEGGTLVNFEHVKRVMLECNKEEKEWQVIIVFNHLDNPKSQYRENTLIYGRFKKRYQAIQKIEQIADCLQALPF